MRDIKDIARYVGLSLIAKGLTVSPLKLQKQKYGDGEFDYFLRPLLLPNYYQR